MGPNPEQNLREQYGSDSGDDQENGDDWHIGYEIEMHGFGIEEYVNSGDDISDESNEDHYAGYQILPTADVSFENTSADHEHTSIVVQQNFDDILTSGNKDPDSEFDIPESIELTEDKIERIKKVMSTFTLPAPSWAKGIASDTVLKKLLEKIKPK